MAAACIYGGPKPLKLSPEKERMRDLPRAKDVGTKAVGKRCLLLEHHFLFCWVTSSPVAPKLTAAAAPKAEHETGSGVHATHMRFQQLRLARAQGNPVPSSLKEGGVNQKAKTMFSSEDD